MRRCCMLALILCLCGTAFAQCEKRIDGAQNFKIHALRIEGVESLPKAEASSLSQSIEQLCFNNARELAERARELFQQRGYFKAAVEDPRLIVKEGPSWPAPADVLIVVDPGTQYRLREITFSGNKAIYNNAALRAVFRIADDEIFDIAQVRRGIKKLKDLYGEFGFIDFTPIPDFRFDEGTKLVTMNVDMEEGKQFYVEQVDIRAPTKDVGRLVDAWSLKVGDLYNALAVRRFFENNRRFLKQEMSERNVGVQENREKATVILHVNLCSSENECTIAYVPCRSDVACENDAAGIPHFVRLPNKP